MPSAARSTTTCHYQAQKAPAAKADVVFAAHEILFQVRQGARRRLRPGHRRRGVLAGRHLRHAAKSRLVIDSLADELEACPGSRSLRQPGSTSKRRICAT